MQLQSDLPQHVLRWVENRVGVGIWNRLYHDIRALRTRQGATEVQQLMIGQKLLAEEERS